MGKRTNVGDAVISWDIRPNHGSTLEAPIPQTELQECLCRQEARDLGFSSAPIPEPKPKKILQNAEQSSVLSLGSCETQDTYLYP